MLAIQVFKGASGVEHGEQGGDGAAAVAQGVLGGEVEFGHGATLGREIKDGIIAEAADAAGGVEDEAFDRALGGVEGLAVLGGDEDAAVAGGALR